MISDLYDINDKYTSLVTGTNLMDFSSVRNYGFISNDNLYIPNNQYIKINTKLPAINFPDSNQALENLLTHLRSHCQFGRIPPTSKFHINNIKITKSYINIHDIYKQYMLILLEKFSLNINKDYLYFSEFFNDFINFNFSEILFMSDFLKTETISVFSTGLAYKIFDESVNEKEISSEYIQDNFFYIFKNICLHYNFIIDKYMPWIIVYRVTDSYIQDNIIRYIDVYESDLDLFFKVCKQLYIYYVNNILNKDKYAQVNIYDFSISDDILLQIYINKKLKRSFLSTIDSNVEKLLRFIKKNTEINGLKDSAYKLNNIREKDYSIYKNW